MESSDCMQNKTYTLEEIKRALINARNNAQLIASSHGEPYTQNERAAMTDLQNELINVLTK